MRQILSTYGILKLAPPAVAAARHVHVSRPRCSCPSCSKYQKGHVRNEHQHVRSAGGSSDSVSGLKFPDSPSCATTQPSSTSPQAAGENFRRCRCCCCCRCYLCCKCECVCVCVWRGVRAHWCCSRSMCSRRDASGSSSRLLHFGAQLLLLLQVQFA